MCVCVCIPDVRFRCRRTSNFLFQELFFFFFARGGGIANGSLVVCVGKSAENQGKAKDMASSCAVKRMPCKAAPPPSPLAPVVGGLGWRQRSGTKVGEIWMYARTCVSSHTNVRSLAFHPIDVFFFTLLVSCFARRAQELCKCGIASRFAFMSPLPPLFLCSQVCAWISREGKRGRAVALVQGMAFFACATYIRERTAAENNPQKTQGCNIKTRWLRLLCFLFVSTPNGKGN